MTTRKQTLQQAVEAIRAGTKMQGVLSCGLEGCPVGGWAKTFHAIRRMVGELPRKAERTYTVNELIDQLYTVDHAGRYRTRL